MSAEVRGSFTLCNRLGLHVRAATRLAQVASDYDARVVVEKGHERARATSVLELLMLCGEFGSEISIVASGGQAREVVEALGNLIAARFDEPD